MAFINYGAAKAAAHRVNYEGKIRNLVEQEQLDNAAIQQRKQEVRYYADKMQTGTSDIPYIQGQLDVFNKEKIDEIGRYRVENPGYEMDINKSAELNRMTGTLLNNSILAEGETSKQNYAAFQEAYQKGELTNQEFVEKSKEWENYQVNGGEGQPFMFNQPERFSMQEMLAAGSTMFNTFKGDPELRNHMWGQETKVDDGQVWTAANVMVNDPKYRASIQMQYKSMAGMYDSPEEMMYQSLKGSKELGFAGKTLDPAYAYNARYQAALEYDPDTNNLLGGGVMPTYLQNIYTPFQSGATATSRVTGAAALTDAGMKSFNMGDPNLHFSIANEDGSFSPMKDMPYQAEVQGDGAGIVFEHGGSKFVSFDVKFKAPTDKLSLMTDRGFAPNFSVIKSDLGENEFKFNSTTETTPYYTGTVIMPFRGNSSNITAYEAANSVGEARRAKMQPYIDIFGNNFEPGDNVPGGTATVPAAGGTTGNQPPAADKDLTTIFE